MNKPRDYQAMLKKREATMIAKYGENWRSIINRKVYETKLKKYGSNYMSEIGKRGRRVPV